MRKLAIGLGLSFLLLAVPAAAEAGVVTISGGVLRYDAQTGQNDEIGFRRDGGQIEVTSPGTTPLSENSGACTQAGSTDPVFCSDSGLSRILAATLDGNDQIDFSDLGAIVGEADLGPGNDVGNVVDQAQPFRVILRGGAGRDTLIGGNLNDVLDGGEDSDLLDGRGGPDDLIGGPGFDELHYDFDFGRTEGVVVTLDDVAGDGAPGEQDNARSDLEDIYGTDNDDELIGNDQSNVIHGLCGNDEITGGGGFDDLRPHAHPVHVFDRDVLCLDLLMLIRVKRAAGRPRDLEVVAELEAIADEIDR